MIDLNASWPACKYHEWVLHNSFQSNRRLTVSQICSLICLPSMLIILAPNSTPIVRSCTWVKFYGASQECKYAPIDKVPDKLKGVQICFKQFLDDAPVFPLQYLVLQLRREMGALQGRQEGTSKNIPLLSQLRTNTPSDLTRSFLHECLLLTGERAIIKWYTRGLQLAIVHLFRHVYSIKDLHLSSRCGSSWNSHLGLI